MASSSSSSSAGNGLGSPPSEKLTRSNYPLWRAQVMPAIRGARRTGLLDGSDAAPSKLTEVRNPDKDKETMMISNPEYEAWLERDQQVLGYLLNSFSKEILMHVLRLEHAAEVWKAVEAMFASQSMSKITNLRISLANTKKLDLSVSAFFAKMQGFADEMAGAGKPLPDDELVSFLLAGLGSHYDALVAALGVVKTPLTVAELFSQVQTYDEGQAMQSSSTDGGFETSANSATRGRNRGGGGGYRPRNTGGRDDLRYFTYSTVGRCASEKLVCAICLDVFEHGETCGEVPACRHFFHRVCVDVWRKSSVTCPLCRGYMAATGSSERLASVGRR